MSAVVSATDVRRSRVRLFIVTMLFLVTTVNYADRATLSIAGPALSKELHLDPVAMGYIFSAFGWSYVIAQVPGGWLLDRYGSRLVYAFSIIVWSLFTTLQGWVGHGYGWRYVFFMMGALGVVMGLVWIKTIYAPKEHPGVNEAEFDYIKEGGALVDLDAPKDDVKNERAPDSGPRWDHIRQLLSNRMMLGVYLGQYCINTLTYFFLTWFPVYLVKERGLSILQAGFVATLPALCGFIGGVLGGVISDAILRKTNSLTLARKIPIVGGMLLSMSIIACNYVDGQTLVVGLMALAFFGKGIGALGWAVVSDTSPKEAGGVSGGLFNTFGNLSSISTPIVIGYILAATGSFNGALVFVGANALVAAFAYLVIVGKIERV